MLSVIPAVSVLHSSFALDPLNAKAPYFVSLVHFLILCVLSFSFNKFRLFQLLFTSLFIFCAFAFLQCCYNLMFLFTNYIHLMPLRYPSVNVLKTKLSLSLSPYFSIVSTFSNPVTALIQVFYYHFLKYHSSLLATAHHQSCSLPLVTVFLLQITVNQLTGLEQMIIYLKPGIRHCRVGRMTQYHQGPGLFHFPLCSW